MLELHLLKGCPMAHRAWIALREKGVAFEPKFFEMGKRPPELEAVGPRAKSPTLFDGDVRVYDSLVVLEYIEERFPEPRLMPASAAGHAQVRMFISRHLDELMPKIGAFVVAAVFSKVRDEAKIAETRRAYVDALPPWNEALAGRKFALGDELTLADLALFTPFVSLRRTSGLEIPAELEHLRAWHDRMAARPSVEYP